MTKKLNDPTVALRAYAKQRKHSRPFKRHAAEFAKRLRSDASDAVEWLAARYVEHYRPEAERAATDRKALKKWQADAEKQVSGSVKILGAALSHLKNLSFQSQVDVTVTAINESPVVLDKTRLTVADIKCVERVFEKARVAAKEAQESMLSGPPARQRGRPPDIHKALKDELINLLLAAGYSLSATATLTGNLIHPKDKKKASACAASIQTTLSARR